MSENEHKSTNPVPSELFDHLNKSALEVGESYDITLDYTNESIENVERILTDIHNEYSKSKDDEGLRGIALEFAAYIVRTIQKNTGLGVWYRDDSQFGKDVFPLEWENGKVLYPLSWCEKRIFDGKADDVWYKYETLVLKKTDDRKVIGKPLD